MEINDKAEALRSQRIKRSLTPHMREIHDELMRIRDEKNANAPPGEFYYLEEFKGTKTLKVRKGNKVSTVTEEELKQYMQI